MLEAEGTLQTEKLNWESKGCACGPAGGPIQLGLGSADQLSVRERLSHLGPCEEPKSQGRICPELGALEGFGAGERWPCSSWPTEAELGGLSLAPRSEQCQVMLSTIQQK